MTALYTTGSAATIRRLFSLSGASFMSDKAASFAGQPGVLFRPGKQSFRGRNVVQLQMKGRNALVTGASKGIGLAISQAFLGAGANVAIVARNQGGLDAAQKE